MQASQSPGLRVALLREMLVTERGGPVCGGKCSGVHEDGDVSPTADALFECHGTAKSFCNTTITASEQRLPNKNNSVNNPETLVGKLRHHHGSTKKTHK